jgi:FkbM family methyltransferase
MNNRELLNYLHKELGKSPLAVRLAILLQNQCRCIIKYHLNEDANFFYNGEAWLARLIAPTSSTFIDVGANIGNWTSLFLEAAPEHIEGLLFEPSDYAIAKLKQRFEGLVKLSLIKAAVSDNIAQMSFFEEPEAGEMSSLVAGFSNSHATKKVVNVTTLDAEVEKRKLGHIDFLKIDTEGYDLHVLRGACGLLSQHQIGLIQFEYGGAWASAGSTLAAGYSLLESYDYQVLLLKSSGLFELDYRTYGEYFGYSNFVAISPQNKLKMKHLVKGKV